MTEDHQLSSPRSQPLSQEMRDLTFSERYFLSLIQVLKVESVGRKARVVLGDETAIIRAFLFESECVKVGETIVLFGAESIVIK